MNDSNRINRLIVLVPAYGTMIASKSGDALSFFPDALEEEKEIKQ